MTSGTTTSPGESAKKSRKARSNKLIGVNTADAPGDASSASPIKKASDQVARSQPKSASKASIVLEMLQQPTGATLEQMVAATGWLPHTTRAMLTGLKKKGHVITSDKVDGVRTYRVALGQSQ